VEVGKDLEFWVLTKEGDIRAAKEVLFSKEFKPEQNWETYQPLTLPKLSNMSIL
jgi:hypothetical protein